MNVGMMGRAVEWAEGATCRRVSVPECWKSRIVPECRKSRIVPEWWKSRVVPESRKCTIMSVVKEQNCFLSEEHNSV